MGENRYDGDSSGITIPPDYIEAHTLAATELTNHAKCIGCHSSGSVRVKTTLSTTWVEIYVLAGTWKSGKVFTHIDTGTLGTPAANVYIGY